MPSRLPKIGGANSMQPLIAGLQAGHPDRRQRQHGPRLSRNSDVVLPLRQQRPRNTLCDGWMPPTMRLSCRPPPVTRWGEKVARNIAVSMGAPRRLVGTIMSGEQVKAAGVHYTMSLAHHLGRQVLAAQRQKSDVPAVVAGVLDGRINLPRQNC